MNLNDEISFLNNENDIKFKKTNLKSFKNELDTFLKNEFDNYFKISGTPYIYEFYNRERKYKILYDFLESIKVNGFIPFENELKNYFYNRYNIILMKCYNEQEQQEKYEIISEGKILLDEEKTEKKEIDVNKIIKTTFIAVLCVIGFPLLFVGSIFVGAMRSGKK